jgi:methylmalonyl-CoA mutase
MEPKNKQALFPEFPPVTREEWEARIREDLAGADYEKKLVWNTYEGIRVQPYYRQEDLEELEYLNTAPGMFPFLRGLAADENHWEIRQEVKVNEPDEAGRKALEMLEKGADAICFDMRSLKKENLASAFRKIITSYPLKENRIHFRAGNDSSLLLALLLEEGEKRKMKAGQMRASFDIDPLNDLATLGCYVPDEKQSFSLLPPMVQKVSGFNGAIQVITIHGSTFINAGSSIVQELAFSLAMANEYLSRLTGEGLIVDQLAPLIQFELAMGSNYFIEIARLRAARQLWSAIVQAYQPSSPMSAAMNIHAVTSGWNKTIYDPNVNMLRATTEAMAAALGGAGAITVYSYDAHYREPAPLSERFARNSQIILKKEAYLDKVADPAAGSYYIESLTDSISGEVWKLFIEVEKRGQFSGAFLAGFIQKQVEATAQAKEMNIIHRKDSLVGTNQYPNNKERMVPSIQPSGSGTTTTTGEKILARPLKSFRGARAFEELRLHTELRGEKVPVVFLFTYGNASMSRARAGFATNFFGCAGFEIIDNPGFRSLEEGVVAVLSQKPDITVLCSADEDYPAIVPSLVEKIGKKTILVVAGYPKDTVEQLKQAGIHHFIHVRSNIIESLSFFQQEIGMK